MYVGDCYGMKELLGRTAFRAIFAELMHLIGGLLVAISFANESGFGKVTACSVVTSSAEMRTVRNEFKLCARRIY